MSAIIQTKNIVKKFPGVVALSNINLSFYAGEVHILLGENGAGKSTLMKILSGAYQPTEGELIIRGEAHSAMTPNESKENGIAIIYQELSVINELSILENLYLGRLKSKKKLGLSLVDYSAMAKEAKVLLERVGVHRSLDTPVEDLSIGEKQLVEISRALLTNADVIIMDEPTTSLTETEVDTLFALVRQLKNEGKSIVYITHKMREIKMIGDRVSVLKDGTLVGTKMVDEVDVPELISMMVGREMDETNRVNRKHDFSHAEVLLEAKDISRADGMVNKVSFRLHRGEIVGFSGLVGAGRTELMNLIFGIDRASEGELLYKGKPINNRDSYIAIQNGFAMVTEDRRKLGFLDNFDLKQNISIASFVKHSRGRGVLGKLNFPDERKWAKEQLTGLRVKCRSMDQNITELSGGNQQKVILGKWLAADSELIIFDEPTKGIDVGSKAEIYQLIFSLADSGKGILVVSSELPELLTVCDRIIVMHEGEAEAEFSIEEATEEKIMKAATGA